MRTPDNVHTEVCFNQGYAEMLENKRTLPGFVICEITGLLAQLSFEDSAAFPHNVRKEDS